MARRSTHAFKLAALLVSSIVICIVLGEIVVRLGYAGKFGPRPGFYTTDEKLGWKPASGLDHVFYGPDFEVAVRTDADGYRLGALGEVDYSKELIILCGDSYSFGWGVSTEQTFASYLDQALSEQAGGRRRAVNLGVGGYGMIQNCDRLADFFHRHNVKPRLALVQHTINDVTDNYRNLGYHLGVWATEPDAKERSRFHLVNLVRYLQYARENPDTLAAPQAKNEPYLQDLLFAYHRTEAIAGLPRHVVMGARTLQLDPTSVREDVDFATLARRQTFTKIQSELMFEALVCIYETTRDRDAIVVHTFIAYTPEWYMKEVTEIARRAAAFAQCRLVITDAMPQPEGFAGTVNNTHSARHFTGEFNRYWADAVVTYLDGMDLLPR